MELRRRVTVGDVVLLTSYFDWLTTCVIQILAVLPEIGKGFESIKSIGEVLESPDMEHNWGKTPVTEVQGECRFKQVEVGNHNQLLENQGIYGRLGSCVLYRHE